MPFVYQAPGCPEDRAQRQTPQCHDPRCVACYAEGAIPYEECSDQWGDSYEIVRCALPKDHTDAPGPDGEWHSQDVTWG